jgi:hypothetical protein
VSNPCSPGWQGRDAWAATPSSRKSSVTTTRYSANKWPTRDTDKLFQRVRQLESQKARESEISKRHEDEITMLKAEIKLLTEKEKEKRSGRTERGMVHHPAVTVTQETEAPFGPAEDTRAEVAEKAAPPMSGGVNPFLFSPCSPKVSSESSEQSVVAPSAFASLPSDRGLAPPSKSTTPNPTFAMNPFLNWSDHDSGKVGDGSLTMLWLFGETPAPPQHGWLPDECL